MFNKYVLTLFNRYVLTLFNRYALMLNVKVEAVRVSITLVFDSMESEVRKMEGMEGMLKNIYKIYQVTKLSQNPEKIKKDNFLYSHTSAFSATYYLPI
jgi:hypothetical protein